MCTCSHERQTTWQSPHLKKIIQGIKFLYEVALKGVHGAVPRVLKSSDIDRSTVRLLDSIFDPSGPYGKLFPGLDTCCLQMKYLLHNSNFVAHVRHQSQIDHAEGCLVQRISPYSLLWACFLRNPSQSNQGLYEKLRVKVQYDKLWRWKKGWYISLFLQL